MIRTIFWILVAGVLGALLFAMFHSDSMTPDENMLLWGSVAFVVMTLLTCFTISMLPYSLKKGATAFGGKYGGKIYSRDSQPFVYWSIMLIYLVWSIVNLIVTYLFAERLLLPLLLRQIR